MEQLTLQAEVREESGKGPARRLRKRGLIPAVLYGPEIQPTPIAVAPKEVLRMLHTDYGRNTVVKLSLGKGREEHALCKDLMVDPVTRQLRHVDFYRVEEKREVEVEVPFRPVGRAAGVQKGGTLHVTLRVLPVRCTPNKIPAHIEIDVSTMEIGDVRRVEDLQLPEGVRVMRAGQRTLVTVMAEEKPSPEEEAAAAAEAAAGAEAAEAGGTPAAS